ncbi:RNA 2',3'-cyclic phosphodiesterase [Nocardioides lentus]|uniref:RNA 2',3'-cyclic phosphodiesterase n=1 Tax=Nocardioides lentus TaxID=338077 RepID=A0ABP5A6M6_9ACTN
MAVRPDEEAVADLEEFLEPRRDALPEGWRWAASEQWHVTLAFADDVDEWRVEELVERVGDAVAHRAAPALAVAGGGAFPHPDGAKVLWADLAGDAGDLTDLSAVTRQAATRAGVRVDGQAFRPHLTVARSARPAQATSWVRLLDAYAGPDWLADEVEVVASHLGEGPRGRPRHEVLASLPLRVED